VEDPQSPGKWQARALQRGPVGEDGVVVEWYQDSHHGYLAMEDGRRVYIHQSVFGGGDLQVGMGLRVLTQPDARNPGEWSVATVKSDLRSPAELLEESQNLQRPCGAVVVDWDLRGYGFVQTDDGRRVYVHHSAFGSGNLAVGERVSVVTIPDQRNPGKLMAQALARDGGLVAQGCQAAQVAQNCQVAQAAQSCQAPPVQDLSAPFSLPVTLESVAAAPPEEWHSGAVSEWHEERGYGFIELTDGRRLYVHHSAFGGGSLLQGMPCEAMAAPDRVNQGKWSAVAVRGNAVLQRPGGATPGTEPAAKRLRTA